MSYITGHNSFGVEPQPGEKHLHLLIGGILRFIKNNKEIYTTETRSVKERWYTPRNTKGAIEAIKSADALQIVFIAENKEYKTITISLTGSSKAIETTRKQCK